MLFQLSVGVIVAVFFITVLFIMVPIHGNAKSTKVVWYIFIIAFATFAFYSEPSVSDDLYRHYKLIDSIRNGNDVNTSLFMFKFILFLVSRTKNNGWLPFFTVIFIGYFVQQIQNQFYAQNVFRLKGAILGYLSALAGLGIFPIVSGIRSALVSAMVIWAYIYFYKVNKKYFYAITIVGCFIHLIALVYLLIIVMHNVIINSKNRNVIVRRTIAIAVMCRVLIDTNIVGAAIELLPGSYGDLLLIKWNGYFGVKLGRSSGGISGLLLYTFFVVAAGCIFYLFIKKKQFDSLIISVVVIVAIASGIDILYDRMTLACGLLMMPILARMVEVMKRSSRYIVTILLTLFFMLNILYSTYSMCSHITFNGIDYREIFRNILLLS